MDFQVILIAVAALAILGFVLALLLFGVSKRFAVKEDPRIGQVLEVLPGANCGGCGFAGCSGLAKAIAKGEAEVGTCPVGGEPVAQKIAEIMGVEATAGVKKVAFVKCQGDCDKTKTDYEYTGVKDCAMLSFVPNGGPKSCNQGCLGYGNCVKACPFDAIHVENGVAKVDKEACKACGKCVAACPKGLIELIPYDAKYAVACSNTEKGAVAMKACETACIGCMLCAKNCPKEAVKVENFNAHIDQDLCVGCGICASKCPKKAIIKV